MRAFAAFVLGMCACYRPTVASDVPCALNGDCPAGQHCDLEMSPPLCLPGDGGLETGGSDASSDAPRDGDGVEAPDAFEPDAYVTPIVFVQKATTKPTTPPTTLALTMMVQQHDAIILCFNFPTSAGATVTAITDSLGNTYTMAVNDVVENQEQHYIAAAYDVAHGTDTITLTLSTTVSGADLMAVEYSGLAHTDAFDVTAYASGNSTAMASGTSTTSVPHELLLGYAEAPSASAGTGYTERATQTGNLVEDRIVFATGSYEATATTTSGGWTMIMATFEGE